MNFTYLPMGSMQLGPNGELIPTSIPSSLSAGRVQPAYHAVAAPPNGASTHNWKMTDLAPLYATSHGHGFAVMDPLSSGHATMVPMAVAGKLVSDRVTVRDCASRGEVVRTSERSQGCGGGGKIVYEKLLLSFEKARYELLIVDAEQRWWEHWEPFGCGAMYDART